MIRQPLVRATPLRRSPPQGVRRSAAEAAAVDRAWRTLTIVNEWVRFLDGKAAAILAADAAITGALLNLCKGELPYFSRHPWLCGPLFGVVLCLACSIFKGLYCIAPTLIAGKAPLPTMFNVRLEPFYTSATKPSVIYFEHIAAGRLNAEVYAAEMIERFSADASTLAEIGEQIHANSVVARNKSIDVGRAIQWLVLALACSLLTALGVLLCSRWPAK